MLSKRLGKIFIGCLVIILILAILGAIFGGMLIKKLITGSIKEKTGIDVTVNDINKGNLTYTDPKTGQTLNIGNNKIPDNFPKDFPVYPGSSVTSSLTGDGQKQDGFWLTLTTKDVISTVVSFYKQNLELNGWKIVEATGENGTNWAVSKDKLSGYINISQTQELTSIVIVLASVNQ